MIMSTHFKEQVSALHNLELVETEETWDRISDSIQTLTELCRDGACEYPEQVVPVIRSLYRPLVSAMKSERTRLSGTAVDLISALAEGLGLSFEPLLALFFPTLLTLCGRPNKVVISRARACIVAIIDNTQLPTVLPFLLQYIKDKSTTLRLAAAESALTAVNALDPVDLEKEPRVQDIEALIKATARDANADIRKVSRGIFSSYKLLFPDRVDRFTDPLTPTMKKYLDIRKQAPPPAPPPHKQPPKKLDLVHNQTSERPAPPTKSSQQSTQSADRQVPTTDPNPPVRSRRPKATHSSSNSRERNNAMPPPPPPKALKTIVESVPSQPKSSKSVTEPAPSRSKSSKTAAEPPAPAPFPAAYTNLNLNIPKSNAPGRVPAKPTQPSSGTMQMHIRQRTVSGPGPMRTLILPNLLGSSHPNTNGFTNAESTPVVQTHSGPQRIRQDQRTESTERKTEQERKAEFLKEIQAQLGLGRGDSDSGKPGRVRVGDPKASKVEKVTTKEKVKLAAQVVKGEREKEKAKDKPVWGGGRPQPQPQPQPQSKALAPAPAPTHVRSQSTQEHPIVLPGKTRTAADAERERPSSKASTRSHAERERPPSKASVHAERERPSSKASNYAERERPSSKASVHTEREHASSKASVPSQTATTQMTMKEIEKKKKRRKEEPLVATSNKAPVPSQTATTQTTLKEVEKKKKKRREEPLVDVAAADHKVPDPTTIPLPRTPSPQHVEPERPSSKASIYAERERPSSKASVHAEQERPSSKASAHTEREHASSKASVPSQPATTQTTMKDVEKKKKRRKEEPLVDVAASNKASVPSQTATTQTTMKEVEKKKKKRREEPLVDVAAADHKVPDPTTIPLPRTPSPQPIPIPQSTSKTPITTLLLSIQRGFMSSSPPGDSPVKGLLGKSQNQLRLKTPHPLRPRRSSSLGDLRGFENAIVFGLDGKPMPAAPVSIFARPKERKVFDDVFNAESLEGVF